MYYPRFTKVIIHHFLIQEKSLSWRNRIGMHTSKDDYLINTLRFVSRKEASQIYGAVLPECLTSPEMKESKAYKTYLGYATGEVPPKVARKFKKASPSKKESELVPGDEEPVKKGKRLKTPAKKSASKPATGIVIREPPVETKSKRKEKEKVDVAHGKGIELLLEVALSEKAQMKEVRKKSLRDFHKTHPSGSGMIVEKPPSVEKITPTVTSKGTGDKPRVPDVTNNDSSESESESWGNDKDDINNKQESSDESSKQENESEEQESDSEQDKESDDDDQKEEEFDQENESEDDEIKSTEEQGMDDTTNQFDDDANARLEEPTENLTGMFKKTEVPVTSSFCSSDLASKFLNFLDIPQTDAEIVSPLDVYGNDEDDNNDEQESKDESTEQENESEEQEFDDSEQEDESDDDNQEEEEVDQENKSEDDEIESDEDKGMDTGKEVVQGERVDAEMIDVQQRNENLETTQEQLVEDAHVTISTITKKTEVPVTSSSLQYEVPNTQTTTLLPIPVSVITTIPLSLQTFTPPPIVSTPTPPPTTEATNPPTILPDFASVFRFNDRITTLEKEVAEIKKDPLHTQVTTLVDEHLDTRLGETREEFMNFLSESLTARIKEQLKKILLDKMEKSESYLTAPEHRDCYDGLKKSYALDKYFFYSYDVYSLKRGRKDKDKDEDPSAGLDQWIKKRKLRKDAEPTTGLKKKDSTSGSSKGTKSLPKSFGKSVQLEEPVFEVADSDMSHDQEGNLGDNKNEPRNETASIRDWFKKPTPP
ncbi:hypothetical protein Tco_0657981 [Tanacetum coccineum]